MLESPPLVRRAERAAADLAFGNSCSPETGRLLHVLAGMRGRLRVGETGTGVGVGAAWMVSALDPSVPFFTAEVDPERAESARAVFAEDANVTVLTGDWRDVLPEHAPYDHLFHDGSKRRPDLVREFWLNHPELAAVEIAVSAREAVIMAVRSR